MAVTQSRDRYVAWLSKVMRANLIFVHIGALNSRASQFDRSK
jgi:hypothetical protein